MKFSIKAVSAAALLVASSLSANAAQWNVTWEAELQPITHLGGGNYDYGVPATFAVSGVVEGVLQGDGNTVLVSDVVSWTVNGDTLYSADLTGGVGSLTNYMANSNWNDDAVFTLDGSNIDFSASNVATDTYIQFGGVSSVDFAYYGTGIPREYAGTVTALSLPLTNWSMTLVPTPVPEPSAALLLLAGLPLLARRRKAA
jgi:hypothetical protein